MSLRAPVAFFVFNRPDLTRRTLAAIARARPASLLVVADGPRQGHPGDAEACRQARALIEEVNWPCDVRTQFSDSNLGCRLRIASGLDWVFSQVPEAIVLEDDCLPDDSFFPFCAELLERYRDEPRIQWISGCNLTRGRRFTDDSYYVSRFFHTWGWASWARAWRNYDLQMRRWPELRETDWIERFLPTAGMARRARYFFDQTHAGRNPAWDYQWVLAAWLQNSLAIVPSTNLVANIGFDARATSTADPGSFLANLPTEPVAFPLKHPSSIEILESADHYEWRLLNPRPGLPRRIYNAMRRRLRL
jgi:hypothetical protein